MKDGRVKSARCWLAVLFLMAAAIGSAQETDRFEFEIDIVSGSEYTHRKWFFIFPAKLTPQIACWIEDTQGAFVKTLYVTEKSASGEWSGGKDIRRPEALPVYFHARVITGRVDLVSGASMKEDKIESLDCAAAVCLAPGIYRIIAEVNSSFDYNDAYPKSKGNVNGQPSVVYAADFRVDESGRVSSDSITLDIIGHGDPSGTHGNLIRETETLTTALEQLERITVTITQ